MCIGSILILYVYFHIFCELLKPLSHIGAGYTWIISGMFLRMNRVAAVLFRGSVVPGHLYGCRVDSVLLPVSSV